ncbi:hypothetical protein DFJ74DRAFT_751708 [Hyaloraphidium curvatum]|nr:hypothetical protein DFJ74DRAFT_751708 [Hyaloraphidium curvatum]
MPKRQIPDIVRESDDEDEDYNEGSSFGPIKPEYRGKTGKIAEQIRALQDKHDLSQMDRFLLFLVKLGHLSPVSIKNYADCVLRIGRLVVADRRGVDPEEALDKVSKLDPDAHDFSTWIRRHSAQDIYKLLKKRSSSVETRKLYSTSMLQATRWILGDSHENCQFWRGIVNENSKLSSARMELNLASYSEAAKFIPFDELQKIVTDAGERILRRVEKVNRLSKRESAILQEVTLAALLTLLPPTRLDQAWLHMEPVDDGNYIDWSKKRIVYQEFKTKQSLGSITVYFGDKPLLVRLFDNLIHKARRPEDKFVFLGRKQEHFRSESTFGAWVGRTFEKLCGINLRPAMLRRLYASHFHAQAPSLAEKVAVARAMGHSPAMNEKYRRYADSEQHLKTLKSIIETNPGESSKSLREAFNAEINKAIKARSKATEFVKEEDELAREMKERRRAEREKREKDDEARERDEWDRMNRRITKAYSKLTRSP